MLIKRRGQPKDLCNFGSIEARIHLPHRLIVNELIGVSLFDNEVLDIGSAPDRPMMLIEHHFGVLHMTQGVV